LVRLTAALKVAVSTLRIRDKIPEPLGSLSRRPIFFLDTTHHDLEGVIRQRPLQHLCFVLRCARSDVALLIHREDYRHRLRMDWRDLGVGLGGQEAAGDREPAWTSCRDRR
jgi:hypothetical protein